MAFWLGYFADSPVYTHLEPDRAQIKLSVVHSAERKGECRRRTAEELAELPANMRTPFDCPRERLPIRIEVLLDGAVVYDETQSASGLAHSGRTRAYATFPAEPGRHILEARMIASGRSDGYDYQHKAEVELSPMENFVIDFRAETGGFRFLDGSATSQAAD
ncbi:MAG TPA: hypothetical protein ENO14_05605 [Chromatiales bacterium]|nr:hypothetical protein [Chromatiales bacterium]